MLAITDFPRELLLVLFVRLAAANAALTMALSHGSASITETGIRRTRIQGILRCSAIAAICGSTLRLVRLGGTHITGSVRRTQIEPDCSVRSQYAADFSEYRNELFNVLLWSFLKSYLPLFSVISLVPIRRTCTNHVHGLIVHLTKRVNGVAVPKLEI